MADVDAIIAILERVEKDTGKLVSDVNDSKVNQAAIIERQKAIAADVAGLKVDVKGMRSTLFGNGDEGLDTQVEKNTQFRKDALKIFWIAAAILLGEATLAIFTLVQLSQHAGGQ